MTKPNLVGVRPWSRSVYLPFIGQIQRYTAQTFFLTEHVSQNSYRGKQHEDDSHSKVNDPAVVLRRCHLVLNRQNLSMTYIQLTLSLTESVKVFVFSKKKICGPSGLSLV